MSNPNKRYRPWCFVWNNYPQNWKKLMFDYCNEGSIKFCVGGEEVAPTTGTRHVQGHFDLKTAKTMSAFQKHIQKNMPDDTPKLTLRQITPVSTDGGIHAENNRNYCYKDDDDPFEFGNRPVPGARMDLKNCTTAIAANPNIKKVEIMELFPQVYAKYPRFVNEYRLLKQAEKLKILQWSEPNPPNLWIWGPPGTGKSRPFEEQGDCYKKPINKWWDGYDGHGTVLLEDVDPSHSKHLLYFLKIWCDRYPFPAEIKGATINIRPQRIVVTSNFSLEACFEDLNLPYVAEVNISALKRRIIVQNILEKTD